MSGGSGDVDISRKNVDQQKVRSVTEAVKVKRTREQGVRLIPLLQKSVRLAAMLLVIWMVGYLGFNLTWVLLGTLVYTAIWEYRRVQKVKEESTSNLLSEDPETLLARVDELPQWVYYPDVERAEWLNKIILKMWPFIGVYVKKLLQNTVAPIINEALPSKLQPFIFETVELGTLPPRVGGVKAYIDNTQRDEIILDIEVMFAGDATLKVMMMQGVRAGIKDITVTGVIRVIMKPLVGRIPLLGGLSIFFLNQPKIDFDLTDVANIFELPLISVALRTIVNDQVANYLVLPHKIPIVLTEIEEALFMIPKGVVRVTVVKAKNLRKADIGFLKKGKSDPYCKISVGDNVYTTKVVQNSIAPVWNETFEFVIDTEDEGKSIKIEVFDEDPGDDDFLGRTKLSVSYVEESGTLDQWLTLEDVNTGEINVLCTWFDPKKDPAALERAKNKSQVELNENSSNAILIVVVDSVKNLPIGQSSPCEPSPYVQLQVGNSKQKTLIKEYSTNPKWEDSFTFLISDASMQELNVEVIDSNTKSKKPIGVRKIPLGDLLSNSDMQISRPYTLRNSGTDTSIVLRLCLRALTQIEPRREVKEPMPSQTVSEVEGVDAVDDVDVGHAGHAGDVVDKKEEESTISINHIQKQPEGNNNASVDGGSELRLRRQLTASNLKPSDTDNKAEIYVRLFLLPDCSNSGKRKTKLSKGSLNPTYDETFYWRVAKIDIGSRTLEAVVKNHVKLFAKGRVNKGLLRLDLSKYYDLAARPITDWYDLTDPDHSNLND